MFWTAKRETCFVVCSSGNPSKQVSCICRTIDHKYVAVRFGNDIEIWDILNKSLTRTLNVYNDYGDICFMFNDKIICIENSEKDLQIGIIGNGKIFDMAKIKHTLCMCTSSNNKYFAITSNSYFYLFEQKPTIISRWYHRSGNIFG